jgi:hypothetical protein
MGQEEVCLFLRHLLRHLHGPVIVLLDNSSTHKLSNSCPKDSDELMEDIIRSMNGVRRSQKKLQGCIEQSELPSFLRYTVALFMRSTIAHGGAVLGTKKPDWLATLASTQN